MQFLRLEIAQENSSDVVLLHDMPARGSGGGHAILHEGLLASVRSRLLRLLAHRESISEVSNAGLADEMGYLGDSHAR